MNLKFWDKKFQLIGVLSKDLKSNLFNINVKCVIIKYSYFFFQKQTREEETIVTANVNALFCVLTSRRKTSPDFPLVNLHLFCILALRESWK